MVKRVWYSTTEACKYLGLHRETLAKLRKEQLEKGKHWKVKNPQARRLTYLYKVSAIDDMQANVITEVPKNEPLNRLLGEQQSVLPTVKPSPISN